MTSVRNGNVWTMEMEDFVKGLVSKLGLVRIPPENNIAIEGDEGYCILEYKGKSLRFPEDCNNSLYYDWIMFDPVNNKNVMKFLMDVFVDMVSNDGLGPYPVSYSKIFTETPKTRLQIIMSDGNRYMTNEYYNNALQYAEVIDYILFGMTTGYQHLDSIESINSGKKITRRKRK